jgi:hypothetical protein
MKKALTITLTFFCLTTFGQFSSYKFSGNAKDSIGSYNGAVKGATLAKDRFGLDSAAYSFSSNNKDYIAVYPSPNIGGKPFGLSVWFNALPSNSVQMKIIDWYACGFSTCLGSGIYSIGLKNDQLHFQIRSNGTKPLAFDTTFLTSAKYDDGIWHHTVLTFDSISGNIAIYIDNQVFQSFNRPFGNMSPDPDTLSVPMSIGRRDESRVGKSWDHFNGKIDDIFIYNEFLSASQVDSLFNLGTINHCPNTFALTYDTTFSCADNINLTLSGSDLRFDYYLLDSVNNTYADGPMKGTGNPLTFNTHKSSKYMVVTESHLSNALKFDGNNDYIAIDNTNGFPMGNAARTMECWMKTSTSGSFDVMVDYGNPGISNNRSSLMMNGSTGRLYFAGESNDLEGISKINDGKWHHTAATYDGVTLKLYVDGKLEATKNLTLATSGNFFKIAQRCNLVIPEHFNGEISKVRIWDASFNIGTIQQLMHACIIGNEANLVVAYNFTEDSSSRLSDVTNGIKYGTLMNMDTINAWQMFPPFIVSNSVDINLNNVDRRISVNGNTLISAAVGANYQWLDCKNNYAQIAGENKSFYTATKNNDYAVEVTSKGCVDTSECLSITTLGLMENSFNDKFVLYPNPTDGNIDIVFENIQTELSVKLFNIAGRLIESSTIHNSNSIELVITGSPGIYFIELIDKSGKKAILKIMKE